MKKLLIAAAVIAAFLQACSDGFKTSDDGLQYQIHTENDGEKIKEGDFVTLQLEYSTDSDSVIFNTYVKPISPEVSKTTKVTFEEAEAFFKKRCIDVNQELLYKKQVFVNNTKLYMFFSVAENGFGCVTAISEHALEIIAADCGPFEVKFEEWNNIR